MRIPELSDLGGQEVVVGDLSIENRPRRKPVIADMLQGVPAARSGDLDGLDRPAVYVEADGPRPPEAWQPRHYANSRDSAKIFAPYRRRETVWMDRAIKRPPWRRARARLPPCRPPQRLCVRRWSWDRGQLLPRLGPQNLRPRPRRSSSLPPPPRPYPPQTQIPKNSGSPRPYRDARPHPPRRRNHPRSWRHQRRMRADVRP